MDILFMGQASLNHNWHHATHRNNINLFYMIIEGEAEIWCNGRHIKMMKDNIYIVPSNVNFAFHCDKYCKKLYFKAKLVNSVGRELPVAPPEGLILTDYAKFIHKMVQLYQKNDYHSALALRAGAEEIILEAMRRTQEYPIHYYSPIITDTLQTIHTAPHLSLSAAALAKPLFISPGHLRNLFSKEVGIPLIKYIRNQVLVSTSDELCSTNLSLKEISMKYGFYDQFHFSRLFTRHFGISPSDYRKTHII